MPEHLESLQIQFWSRTVYYREEISKIYLHSCLSTWLQHCRADFNSGVFMSFYIDNWLELEGNKDYLMQITLISSLLWLPYHLSIIDISDGIWKCNMAPLLSLEMFVSSYWFEKKTKNKKQILENLCHDMGFMLEWESKLSITIPLHMDVLYNLGFLVGVWIFGKVTIWFWFRLLCVWTSPELIFNSKRFSIHIWRGPTLPVPRSVR